MALYAGIQRIYSHTIPDTNIEFNEYFFTNFADGITKSSWASLSKQMDVKEFSLDFFFRFQEEINWRELLNNKSVDTQFLRDTMGLWEFFMIPKTFVYEEEFIREFSEDVHWSLVGYDTNSHLFYDEFIEEFKKHIEWEGFSYNHKFTDEQLDKYQDFIRWDCIVESDLKLSDQSIIKFFGRLEPHLDKLCSFHDLSLDILNKYIDYWPIEILCRHQSQLPEEFIYKHADKLHWQNMSMYQNMSEKCLLDHWKKVEWDHASRCQVLSEKFIEENHALIDFSKIGRTAPLSDRFIIQYQDKLNWEYICEFQDMSVKTLSACKERLKWRKVSKHQKMSPDFVKSNSDRIDFGELFKNEDVNLTHKQKQLLKTLNKRYV